MEIRPETPADIVPIDEVTRAAFHGDDGAAAELVRRVRASDRFLPDLSLVAIDDNDEVIGHIMFSGVDLQGPQPRQVLSLAPMCVHPDHQGNGIGRALMEAGIAAVQRGGHDIVILEGIPSFYPKFGFEPAGPAGITKPHDGIPDVAWMVLFVDETARGTTGTIVYPPAFYEAGATGA